MQRLEAMPAHFLDQPVRYVEPYDDRRTLEPDFVRAAREDVFDVSGRLCVGKGEPFLA